MNHYVKKYLHFHVHATLLTIVNIWNQAKCSSRDKWIKKIRYIYTKEYCSAIERKKSSSVTAWMNLEDLMPREINQMWKD